MAVHNQDFGQYVPVPDYYEPPPGGLAEDRLNTPEKMERLVEHFQNLEPGKEYDLDWKTIASGVAGLALIILGGALIIAAEALAFGLPTLFIGCVLAAFWKADSDITLNQWFQIRNEYRAVAQALNPSYFARGPHLARFAEEKGIELTRDNAVDVYRSLQRHVFLLESVQRNQESIERARADAARLDGQLVQFRKEV